MEPSVFDVLRVVLAAVLIMLALAAIVNRHVGILRYLIRSVYALAMVLLFGLSFGRVRLVPWGKRVRAGQKRRARERRFKQSADQPAGPGGAGWSAGTAGGAAATTSAATLLAGTEQEAGPQATPVAPGAEPSSTPPHTRRGSDTAPRPRNPAPPTNPQTPKPAQAQRKPEERPAADADLPPAL